MLAGLGLREVDASGGAQGASDSSDAQPVRLQAASTWLAVDAALMLRLGMEPELS